jgi:hypothetical protein
LVRITAKFLSLRPGGRRRGLAIRRNADDRSPLQVANDGSIAVATLAGKVIDANEAWGLRRLNSATADNARQGVIAHGWQQALCKALSRPSAWRQPQMMNNPLKTRGPARERGTNRALTSLGENLASVHPHWF